VTALFYISGHGFGHASREVEIIHALATRMPGVRIVIRSAVSPALLSRTLQVPFELRPGPCDTGIIQKTSIQHDDEATVVEAIRFYSDYPAVIDRETGLAAAESPALIVGDIAPVAFEVADRLGVPGVAIANFTWDWIYETHPGLIARAAWLPPLIRASYVKASHALELPFAGGFDVFRTVTKIPLVARRPMRGRDEVRAQFGLEASRPAALLSFGGYGLPDLELGAVDCLDRWTILTTDRVTSSGRELPPGVRLIQEEAFVGTGFRYEDLVGAVDVVMTKPGYGIIAECISTGGSILYTSRGEFREYDVLVREMPRYLRSRFISQEDLLAGRWARELDALLRQPAASESIPTSGADVAADALAVRLSSSS